MHHESILIADERAVPQRFAQRVYGDDVPAVIPQLFQKQQLLGRQGYLLPGAAGSTPLYTRRSTAARRRRSSCGRKGLVI